MSQINSFLSKEGKPIQIALRFYVVWLVIGGLGTLTISAINAAPHMNKYTNVIVFSFIIGLLAIFLALVAHYNEKQLLGIPISSRIADKCQDLSTGMVGSIIFTVLYVFIVERSRM